MAKTVLVADDNATIRREMCRPLLREMICEVCGEVQHGLDAIEQAQVTEVVSKSDVFL
jgi:AmiR/NasT family two-component response regulator